MHDPYQADDTPLTSKPSKRPFLDQLTSSRRVMRNVMIACSVLFMVVALVMIGTGAWAVNAKVVKVFSNKVPIGVIVIGCVLLAISLLGFLSSYTGNKLLITINGVILVLICLIFVALSIAIFVVAGKIKTDFYMNDISSNYHDLVQKDPQDVCGIEKELGCSGFFNDPAEGYAKNATCHQFYDTSGNFTGVCTTYDKSNAACFCPKDCEYDRAGTYTITCYAKLRDEIKDHFTTCAAVSLTFDILLMVGCIFNWCLCCRGRRRENFKELDPNSAYQVYVR